MPHVSFDEWSEYHLSSSWVGQKGVHYHCLTQELLKIFPTL